MFLVGNCYYIDEHLPVRKLWSIGNWNSKMKKQERKDWYELAIGDIISDSIFDEYTLMNSINILNIVV